MAISITPTDTELIWLRELYRRQREGGATDPWEVQIALRDQLPKDFRPSQISYVFSQNNLLTLFGIIAIDPGNPVIQDTEQAILAIRNLLIDDPKKRIFTAKEVSEQVGKPQEYVEQLFGYLLPLGNFWSSANRDPDGIGFSSIAVEREECLAQYLDFESIEEAIQRRLKHYEDARRWPEPINQSLDAYLADRTLNPAQLTHSRRPDDEILHLKPSFFGIGVNLKALWRWILAQIKQRQSS